MTDSSRTDNNDMARMICPDIRSSLSLKLENNLEDYIVVWVDTQLKTSSDCSQTIEDLCAVADCVECFEDVETCIQYVVSKAKVQLFVILSSQLARSHIINFQEYEQVCCIYVFCMKEQTIDVDSSKIRGIFVKKESLLTQLNTDIKFYANRWSFVSDRSLQDFEGNYESASHWYQFLYLTITTLPPTDDDFQSMLSECRLYYKRYPWMLRRIDEFEKNYTPEQALHYYTKQSFPHTIINCALRTQDPKIIVKFRSFIVDLYNQLCKLSEAYRRKLPSLGSGQSTYIHRVYRGQYLTITELQYLQKQKHHYHITNAFFSATQDRNVALQYISEGQSPPRNLLPTLFDVSIVQWSALYPTDELLVGHWKPYAPISSVSQFRDECEVLFSPGDIWRLISVELPSVTRPWAHVTFHIDDLNQFSLIGPHFIMYRVSCGELVTTTQLLTVLEYAWTIRTGMNWRFWCMECTEMQRENSLFSEIPLVMLMLDYMVHNCKSDNDTLAEAIYRKSVEFQMDIIASHRSRRLQATAWVIEQVSAN